MNDYRHLETSNDSDTTRLTILPYTLTTLTMSYTSLRVCGQKTRRSAGQHTWKSGGILSPSEGR